MTVGGVVPAPADGGIVIAGSVLGTPGDDGVLSAGDVGTAPADGDKVAAGGVAHAPGDGSAFVTGGIGPAPADSGVVAAGGVVLAPGDGGVVGIARRPHAVASLIVAPATHRAVVVGDAVGAAAGPAPADGRSHHARGDAVAVVAADDIGRSASGLQPPAHRPAHRQGQAHPVGSAQEVGARRGAAVAGEGPVSPASRRLADHRPIGADLADGAPRAAHAPHPPLQVGRVGAEEGAAEHQPRPGAVGGVRVGSRGPERAIPREHLSGDGRCRSDWPSLQRARRAGVRGIWGGGQQLAGRQRRVLCVARALHLDLQPEGSAVEHLPKVQLHGEPSLVHRYAERVERGSDLRPPGTLVPESKPEVAGIIDRVPVAGEKALVGEGSARVLQGRQSASRS